MGQSLAPAVAPLPSILLSPLPGAGPGPRPPSSPMVTWQLLMCGQSRGQFPRHGLLALGSLGVVQVGVAAGVTRPVRAGGGGAPTGLGAVSES